MRYYLHIIRPANLLIMAIMLLLVRFAIFVPIFRQNGIDGLMPVWQFMLLVMATLFIGAGGYVINDVLDIELDKINKPEKQVIGRKISEATGNKLHVNLTAIGSAFGLAFSYFSGNIYLGVIFVIIPTALFYYSFIYKYLTLIGNLVVALLVTAVVCIYWLFEFYYLKGQSDIFIEASLFFSQINRFVLAFAIFAFLTTFTREIIKDVQDMEGDSKHGCRTLPIVLGIRATRYVILLLELIIAACLGWFQFILSQTGYHLMFYLLMITQAILLFALIKTAMATGKSAFTKLSLVMKIVMISGMASLLATWFRNF